MKRLRAPEQSDTKAASPAAGAPADPAAGAPADPAAPQAAADPSAPSSVAPPEGGVTEVSQPVSEAEDGAAALAAEQPIPAPQEAEPTSRCNGDASAALHAGAEAGDEQG